MRRVRVDTFDVTEIRSMTIWEQIMHLAANPIYLFTVLALVCYFDDMLHSILYHLMTARPVNGL